MKAAGNWLDQHTTDAPAALRDCVRQNLDEIESGSSLPDTLAQAAERALRHVLEGRGGRAVALELLTADGLITLALLHQAEHEPAELAALARRLAFQHGAV